MKIFVFGIGGTGARVLRSLTMLLASGVKIKNPDAEFIPIIVDMDTANGDTDRTKKLINKYREIRETSYTQKTNEGFFAPVLKNLASYKADNFKGYIQDSFQLEFGNIDDTFYRYIKGDQLDPINENLMEALFDNSPPTSVGGKGTTPTELHLKLSLGFKGNPNIGSIVFNNLKHTDEYRYFEDICSENDKVFIVSSIFGGTGSAGFPQLVKSLRNSDKLTVKNVQIGALVVMPYFNIGRAKESVIDANNFKSKTKAALSYYASELDGLVNDTYYIGCNEIGDAYENHEGGESQKNNAHIVELLGASGILHFVNNNKPDMQGPDWKKFGFNYFEYGIKSDSSSIDFRHFFQQEHANLLALVRLGYFSKFVKEQIGNKRFLKSQFAKHLNLSIEKFQVDHFYAQLNSFLTEDFYTWLQELEKNKPAFEPFNLNEDYRRFIKHKEVKRLDEMFFIQALSKLEKQNEGIRSERERFMVTAYQAFSKAVEVKLEHLPAGEF